MVKHQDIKTIKGLSEQQAADRLKQEGFHELPTSKPRNVLTILFQVIREPMFLLLVAGGLIYLSIGDLQEAIMLLGFVLAVIGITFYQERKTERALEALRDLSSPRAMVIRDGGQRRIAGREVVREDVVVLSEGDRVPADGVVLWCSNFMTDESLLTGESVPVRKTVWDGRTPMSRPGGDDLGFVYSGSLVVKGQGIVQVRTTGMNTEIGKIGKALQTLTPQDSRLKKEVRWLVKNVAVFGVGLSAIVLVVYGLTRDDWQRGFLAGITLAMAIMPEEFPVVLTIFFALGAWRISRKRVLTRRIPTIETLGSATVLCVDKTGTLTQNRMLVGKIAANGETFDVHRKQQNDLPEKFHEVVEYAILASQRDPFDPMDKALRSLGRRTLTQTEHLHDDWSLIGEYPLSPELLALSHVWRSPDGKAHLIAAKGAPEAIADLCHFSPEQTADMERQGNQLAEKGLRVLGVARADFQVENLPEEQHEFEFKFLGLIGFDDPVRPTVIDALDECRQAGIRVVMITGDYPATAQNVARQIGLENPDTVITGPELEQMDDRELERRIGSVNLFARMVPEQKLKLVHALQANREIVAMTGDGVNDAPALKAADIGIAMGGRGTDVARESSDLVLLDDDFSSIVGAVRMGRRIFDNLKKAVAYILAIHVPIAGMSLLPVLFGWPLMLFPVHIVFLELIIDPACSIAFEAEPEEANVMRRRPRDLRELLFSGKTVGLSVLQGTGVLAVILVMYGTGLAIGYDSNESRTLAFVTLIFANLGLILINRSWTRTSFALLKVPNRALWWIVGGAVLFLSLVLHVPFLQNLFMFVPLRPVEVLLCLAAGVASVLWFEVFKRTNSWRKNL